MTDKERIDSLMEVRIELIALWPGCQWPINTIFPSNFVGDWESFPHLFKRLYWWERRKKSEFPSHIKYDDEVLKVRLFGCFDVMVESKKYPYGLPLELVLPAINKKID